MSENKSEEKSQNQPHLNDDYIKAKEYYTALGESFSQEEMINVVAFIKAIRLRDSD